MSSVAGQEHVELNKGELLFHVIFFWKCVKQSIGIFSLSARFIESMVKSKKIRLGCKGRGMLET